MRTPALALLLVVVVVITFLPTLQGGFLWDDDGHVTANPHLRSLSGLRAIWLDPGATQQYYPMTYTSFWLEFQSFGLTPRGYHVMSLLLHAVNALLLWQVLRKLGLKSAYGVAVVFAVHPVQVETVAWISERKNLLSAAFFLAATLAWWPPVTDSGKDARPWLRRFALPFVLYAAALFSKTIATSWPAVMLLLLWWRRPATLRQRWSGLIPFFVLGLALSLITVVLERGSIGAQGPEWELSPLDRICISGRALWFYVGKLLVPIELCFSYGRWPIDPASLAAYLPPTAWILAMGILWRLRSRLGAGPLVAGLCFSGSLLPALGWINLYPMRYTFVADHYQYLACAFLLALGGEVVVGILPQRTSVVRSLLLIAVAAVPAVLSHQRTKVFASNERLYRDTLRQNPDSWMAHHNLGRELEAQGRLEEAATQLEQALKLRPLSAQIHVGLGTIRARQGNFEAAERHLRDALHRDPRSSAAHNGLGILRAQAGDHERAIHHYRAALVEQPNFAECHNNLAGALAALGQLKEAAQHFEAALQLQPGNAITHFNLGGVLEQLGNPEAARQHYQTALRLHPDLQPAQAALQALSTR